MRRSGVSQLSTPKAAEPKLSITPSKAALLVLTTHAPETFQATAPIAGIGLPQDAATLGRTPGVGHPHLRGAPLHSGVRKALIEHSSRSVGALVGVSCMTTDAPPLSDAQALARDLTPDDIEAGDAVAPVFEARSIAAALIDRQGAVAYETPAFQALRAEGQLDPEALVRMAQEARAATTLVELKPNGAAETALFAHARADQAMGWRLPPEVHAAAVANPNGVVVLAGHVAATVEPLEAACRAYGLSGLQTRVALETIRTGSVKAAAARLDISFHTAREALAEVMRRTHSSRLPAVVLKLSTLAFGVLPEENAAERLTDLWALTPRQAAIAGLVASGMARADAARAMSLSEAVVKKELDQVYQVLQVSSATALARRLVEANALHWLTRATRGDVGFVDAGAEPLQFAHRADGSRIAISDYGPASGRPVLVVHSALTTRPVSRGLIRELHRAGYRPIAIDRPGFGMSDELRAPDAGRYDPHAAAAADTVTVLDKLRVRTADVVARGAARSVLGLHALAPERLGRVVLVNPGLHAAEDTHKGGLFGLLKQAYHRNPAMIRVWVTYVARHVTYERHKGLMSRWMRGSPPDEAAIEDATIVRDYFHAQRMFATGRLSGYVAEQTEYLRGTRPAVVRGTFDWRVLVGAHDTMYEPGEVLACWRDVLPDAGFRVLDDAGRLLAMSHPHYVVEALQAPA